MYKPDGKRMSQVKAGIYKKMSLPGFETPSGVYYKPTKKNAFGTDISLGSKDVKLKQSLSKSQSKKVLRFINKGKTAK